MWNPHLANQEEEGADFNEHLLGAGYTPGGQPTFSKLLSWKVVDPGVSDSLIHLPIHSFHSFESTLHAQHLGGKCNRQALSSPEAHSFVVEERKYTSKLIY